MFGVNTVDLRFYADHLRDFLPGRIVDIHTHVYRLADCVPDDHGTESRTVSWPNLVARENPIEDLRETYRLLFPDKQVTPLIFASVPQGENINRLNRYVAEVARTARVPALLFSHPAWSAESLDAQLSAGGFLGVKSYLTLAPAYLPAREIRILDFFPPHQLEVLNRRRAIVMLHIPRDGRLQDPVNLAQILHIERSYPELQLIVAHVGRAYCREDVGEAFEVLRASRRCYFDISANTNAEVFAGLIRCVGPRRILFGSDLPVTRMRMRRVTRDGRYLNLVPRGAYGDISDDPHMGEVDGEEAARLTFFLYEELEAFRQAAMATGLTAGDIEDVFYRNAQRIMKSSEQ